MLYNAQTQVKLHMEDLFFILTQLANFLEAALEVKGPNYDTYILGSSNGYLKGLMVRCLTGDQGHSFSNYYLYL